MEEGSRIYSLEALSQDPLATRNTIMFAALTAMGVPAETGLCGEFIEDKGNGKVEHTTVWRLKETSICGNHKTADLIRLFTGPDLARNPEHPLAYIKEAFGIYRQSLAVIHGQGPTVSKGSKVYSLESLSQDPLATRNTIMFAALRAMRVPEDTALFGELIEDKGRGNIERATVWRLKEKSVCGRHKTADLIRLFEDPDFIVRDPEHPLAYIKQAFENHRRSLEFINEQGPIVMKRRGKKIGLITRHTTPENRKRILEKLNQ